MLGTYLTGERKSKGMERGGHRRGGKMCGSARYPAIQSFRCAVGFRRVVAMGYSLFVCNVHIDRPYRLIQIYFYYTLHLFLNAVSGIWRLKDFGRRTTVIRCCTSTLRLWNLSSFLQRYGTGERVLQIEYDAASHAGNPHDPTISQV